MREQKDSIYEFASLDNYSFGKRISICLIDLVSRNADAEECGAKLAEMQASLDSLVKKNHEVRSS